jgi:hypothetical protein
METVITECLKFDTLEGTPPNIHVPSRRPSHKEPMDWNNEQAVANTKGILTGTASTNRVPQQTIERIVSIAS